MNMNPYASPAPVEEYDPALETLPSGARRQGTIALRVFGGTLISFLTPARRKREIRLEAQQAIDEEIGKENVVAVVERKSIFEAFGIFVWYRT